MDKNRAFKGQEWAALLLLSLAITGCGGGAGAGGGDAAGSAASRAAVAKLAPAPSPLAPTYSLVNLSAYGYLQARKPINALGQVIFQDEGLLAAFYDGSSIRYPGSIWGGLSGTRAYDLNDSGQVTGESIAGAQSHAFVWSTAGGMTDLGTLNAASSGSSSSGHAINSAGQVTGSSRDVDGNYRTFLWTPGQGMADLGTLGGNYSSGIAINKSGQLTGNASVSSYQHAFVWRPGDTRLTDLGTLGESSSFAQDINTAGQVVGISGYTNSSGAYHAFVWNPGDAGLTDLGTLGGRFSNALAINDSGQVAGWANTAGGIAHAVVWNAGDAGLTDLGTLGGTSSRAAAINNLGQVVGTSDDASGQPRAFAWTAADGMVDLSTRIANAPLGVELYSALAISDNGSIVASSNVGLVLLKAWGPPSAAPAVGPIAANDPVAVGSAVTMSARFTDADPPETHVANWTFGDGWAAFTDPVLQADGSSAVSVEHIYTAAGVYRVTLEVTDSSGSTGRVSRDVVVYDPSAGFVTGTGWLMSPPGAFKQDPMLAGRANFGFVSKYAKGATQLSGVTQFQFQTAKLNFHSNDYEWLVVAGARAQYKGNGTVNGTGDFKFMLTAVDGDLTGGGGMDRFRIKIWHYDADAGADVVDYDNQLDTGSEGTASEGTAIGGGSIVIHK